MRSREGSKRPCRYCGESTLFVREVVGPRGGHVRWEDCCVDCGERPARRAGLVEERPAREATR
jgi:hypothetical protein